ncbi:MAG: tetratricopeptide repeat protein [Candidatus Delongbacteria bacterium]|jgi:tetratricopeptide (TPR) repeat protein|nr:tetratricopeptide repeat protein [Candidatus Delongbacteria bacterium]
MKYKLVTLLILTVSLFAELSFNEIKSAYNSSYTYETATKYKIAISSLKKVIEAYPKGYTVNYRLGWLYYLAGNYANSVNHLNTALLTYPYSVEVLNTLNLVNVARLDWDKVESQSINIFKIDYYNYYANYWYSVALMRQKKYDQAIKVTDKMLAVFPTNVVFLNILAESNYLNGNTADALNVFESVVILDKDNETAKYYLGKK